MKNYLFILIATVSFANISVGHAQYSTYTVSSYSYAQFGTSDTASIDLYDSRNKQVGILIFMPVSADQLPLSSQDINGLVRLYYTIESLASVVDLLRNESPIRLRYWHGVADNSHIGTYKKERVGEGE
jgi:hypothetical protein